MHQTICSIDHHTLLISIKFQCVAKKTRVVQAQKELSTNVQGKFGMKLSREIQNIFLRILLDSRFVDGSS